MTIIVKDGLFVAEQQAAVVDETGNITGHNLTLSGDLTVNGITTTVNSTNLEVTDNIIVLNNGQLGPGVSLGTAGIQIDRGDLANYQILFDESDDLFKIGTESSLQIVATREWIGSNFSTSFEALTDVSINNKIINNYIKWNGIAWINSAISFLDITSTPTSLEGYGITSGNGSNLTSLNASNLSSGTVNTARLGTGTADSTTYLRGDNTWATIEITSSLSGLSDVNLSATPTTGNILTFNGTNWDTNIDVNLTNKKISGPTLSNYSEQINTQTSITNNVLTIDLAHGNNIVVNLVDDITDIVVNNSSNWQTNTLYAFALIVVQNSSSTYDIQWPENFKWDSSIPTVITQELNKIDVFNIISYDGGASWLCFVASQNMG